MDPIPSSAPRTPARSTIRGALTAGFAIVFGLWLFSGYELVRNLRDVEREVTEVHASVLRGEEVLSTVRTSVLLGSIYLRDALLNPTPESIEGNREEFGRLRDEVRQVLTGYLPEVETQTERDEWAKLQSELEAYWKAREFLFEPGAVRSFDLLTGRVVPTRESIIRIIDALSAVHRSSIARHEAAAATLYGEARVRVVTMASMAIVVGLIVAFVASRQVGRLEREIEFQRTAEGHNRRDLERLSARLVHAQEEERRSLSRELHDAVGQALTAIKIEMGVAMRGVENDPKARGSLEEARAIAESTLQNVRDLSQVLHPSMLDDFGLPEALTAYLKSFSARTGIRASLVQERMEDRLSPEVEVCVYRIVQEALTNVSRHSGASSCTVALIRRDGRLYLTIEDDGQGIEVAAARSADIRRGLGLIGMRERAQALSGAFVIENRPGGGTMVRVQLPAIVAAAATERLAG